jgi:hypothetical protein
MDLNVPIEDYERWYRYDGKDHEVVENTVPGLSDVDC